MSTISELLLCLALQVFGVLSQTSTTTPDSSKKKNGFLNVFENTIIPPKDVCPSSLRFSTFCKFHKDSNSFCQKSTGEKRYLYQHIYATWEQVDNCGNFDYYKRAGQNHLKNSGWIYNITTNWTTFFDNRARSIKENGKGTFICQFAAKRYDQLRDPNFFHGIWQPSAIKCVNYLANARRSMMCAACSPDEEKAIEFIEAPTSIANSTGVKNESSSTTVNLKFTTCTDFMANCIDYIENKQKFIDKMNVAFTLALCDRDGLYQAQGTKSYYKKVLPSNVVFDEEDIELCRKTVKKDLTMNEAQTKASEDSCLGLCSKHFSLSTMILDDIQNLNNLKYMHDILKEIVSDNWNVNLFNAMMMEPAEVNLDFTLSTPNDPLKDQLFNFKFGKSTDNNSPTVNLEKYVKDNGFKVFEAANFVKSSLLLKVTWLMGLILSAFTFN